MNELSDLQPTLIDQLKEQGDQLGGLAPNLFHRAAEALAFCSKAHNETIRALICERQKVEQLTSELEAAKSLVSKIVVRPCPKCGGLTENAIEFESSDFNSYWCDRCNMLWPLSESTEGSEW